MSSAGAVPIEERVWVQEHDSVLGRWTEAFCIPHPELAPFVASLWHGDGATSYTRDRILPQGCAHLFVNLGPPQYLLRREGGAEVRLPFCDIWLSGPQLSPLDTEAPEGTSVLGVAFTPHGAYRVLGLTQRELAGKVVELSALLGDRVLALRQRLLAAKPVHKRLGLLEQWLLASLRAQRPGHSVVPYLIGRISDSGGQLGVREMTRDTGFSRMHLGRLLSREVGLTAKALSRIYRFHAALVQHRADRAASWGDIALHCGYYDQSHLIRDFRVFAGRTPEAVARSFAPDPTTLVVLEE